MKKYNGTAWVDTTLRQYKTATADIEPTIYTDGTAITSYTIKGNTVQNGTPTPSAPIAVQGVGELDSGDYKIPISNGQQTTNIYLGSTQTVRQIKKLVLTGEEGWSGSDGAFYLTSVTPDYMRGRNLILAVCSHYNSSPQVAAITSVPDKSISFSYSTSVQRFYLVDSSYTDTIGLKTYLQQQYSAGTPVTIWYVLATPETAAVNEPLMKIGDYADSISNAASIPTTEGANSITVDTTVQPSEFTATWTGWHDASVKEWDGSQWS